MAVRPVSTSRPRVTGWVAHTIARLVRPRGLGPRATAVGLSVTARLTVANATAGLFVVAYLTLTDGPDEVPGNDWTPVLAGNAVFYGLALVAFTIAAIIRGKRLFAPAWVWLDDADRRPSPAEQRALLGQPLRIGLLPLRYWTLAALLAGTSELLFESDPGRMVVQVVTVLEGGMVASVLGYLLSERALREVRAEALAGEAPRSPAAMGIGTRLVLAWALGAGVPLLGVILTPLVVDDSRLDVTWAMAFLGCVGIVSGLSLTIITARSITHPVARVREALSRVGGGELDTSVVVDDPGELGQLQAGVNEMVRGLRERAQLEDLFGRHVGVGVARRALARGAELGGEVRNVSALFVDLTGSTDLARRLPPIEVVALLNQFFEAVVRCSDAEGGWIDKFEGDAALCVFGAPDDLPDHATRALRAGRALAAEIEALRRRRAELDAGIGIASGDAVAGHIGTESRLEYTVIGDPVNTAARLSDAAKERGPRLLAAASAVAAADPAERECWADSGTVDLKGLAPGLRVLEPRVSAGARS